MDGDAQTGEDGWDLLLVLILLSVSRAQTLEIREEKQTLQSPSKKKHSPSFKGYFANFQPATYSTVKGLHKRYCPQSKHQQVH